MFLICYTEFHEGFTEFPGGMIDILVTSLAEQLKFTSSGPGLLVDELTDVHEAQIAYMRLGDFPIGLILNFKTALLKSAIRRFVL